MIKFVVSILALIAIVACNNSGDDLAFDINKRDKNVTTSSGSVLSTHDSEDLTALLKEHANYGKLFRSIMESIDNTCDIFYDYLSDVDYSAISFAESGNSHLLDSSNENSYGFY